MAEWSKALVSIRQLWQAWVQIPHLTIDFYEKIDANSFQLTSHHSWCSISSKYVTRESHLLNQLTNNLTNAI